MLCQGTSMPGCVTFDAIGIPKPLWNLIEIRINVNSNSNCVPGSQSDQTASVDMLNQSV